MRDALAAVGIVVLVLNGIAAILKAILDIAKHVEERVASRRERRRLARLRAGLNALVAKMRAHGSLEALWTTEDPSEMEVVEYGYREQVIWRRRVGVGVEYRFPLRSDRFE